ncbi:hypothetical protein [Nitrosospira sp. Nl5]|uniref:hypothetical protein n=1 Tax=Nitrosospira sp. Nl5 TaxID=200120 RepID=UPI000B84E3FD|nr:hypothetical protein [Nitrosospira sp. Nl5]
MPLIQGRLAGFAEMYERHAGFVGGPLARKINRAESCADPGKFIFGMNQSGGARYGAAGGEPVMQRLPGMRYAASRGMGSARNGGNAVLGELSFTPPGGAHNDPVTGSAGSTVQAKSALPHVLAPEDRRGSGSAEVAATSKAGNNPATVERMGQGHIARKAGLSEYSKPVDASANNAQIGNAFSGSNIKGHHGRSGTSLPISMDAATGPVASPALPGAVSSRLPVQRSLSFSYRHPLKPQSHSRSPQTLSSGASGVIARQLQNTGSDRTASRLLEPDQTPSGRPTSGEIIRRRGRNRAVSEAEPGFESALLDLADERHAEPISKGFISGIPAGSSRSGQIVINHSDARLRHHARVLRRLPISSPMMATRDDTFSIQPSLGLPSTHLANSSRLSGRGLQPLNSDLHRPPEREPVRDGLPVISSAPLQRLSRQNAPETLRNPPGAPDAPGFHVSRRQHDNVPILREPITRGAGSLAMDRDAAATGGTDTIVSSALPPPDGAAAGTEVDPASHIPFRPGRILQAQPVVRRSPGSGSPWARPLSPGAARHDNMPSSTQGLSRSALLHSADIIRPSRSALQSPREPISSRTQASLYQVNRHALHQYNNLPVSRKTIAPSVGNDGLDRFSTISDTATAIAGPDHSTASIARFSNSAESRSLPREAGPAESGSMLARTVIGETQTSGVLAGIATPAATAFGAMPSATPAAPGLAAGRIAAGIAPAQPLAQRRIQNNLRAIVPAPLALPHAAHRQAITGTGSSGHEGTSSSHASVILADAGIVENEQSIGSHQETRGVYGGWTAGAAGRPLVTARRTRDQLMRATGDTAGASAYSPSSATSEDRYGVVPVPREGVREAHVAPGGGTSGIAAPVPGEPDPDEIAEQAWRIMMERLVIEQERRGLAKWP